MEADEVCEQLGITRSRLGQLVKRGLPWTGKPNAKQFDEREVKIWLIEQGVAQPTRRLVTSLADVAAHLACDQSTIKKHSRDVDFPGKNENGFYDMEAIDEWWEQRKEKSANKKRNVLAESSELSIQDQIRKLKLEKELGQLVSVDDVEREMERTNNLAVGELHNIPAKVESRLPGDLRQEVKSMIREAIVTSIDEAIAVLEEMIEGHREIHGRGEQ